MSVEWTSYVDDSEELKMHVMAVPNSVVEGIKSLIPAAHKRAIVGDVTLLVFLINNGGADRIAVKNLLEHLLNESISHNYAYFNTKSKMPDTVHSIRYSNTGELIEKHNLYADPSLIELLERLLREVYLGREILQIAHCYAMDADWENHEANGQMNKMRKLVGGL